MIMAKLVSILFCWWLWRRWQYLRLGMHFFCLFLCIEGGRFSPWHTASVYHPCAPGVGQHCQCNFVTILSCLEARAAAAPAAFFPLLLVPLLHLRLLLRLAQLLLLPLLLPVPLPLVPLLSTCMAGGVGVIVLAMVATSSICTRVDSGSASCLSLHCFLVLFWLSNTPAARLLIRIGALVVLVMLLNLLKFRVGRPGLKVWTLCCATVVGAIMWAGRRG